MQAKQVRPGVWEFIQQGTPVPVRIYANERILFNGSWVTPNSFLVSSRVDGGLGYGGHTGLTAYNGILNDFNWYADAEL